MSKLFYIQLHIPSYLSDTAHLSTAEHGAYLLLIFNYWQRGSSFSAEDEKSLDKILASVAKIEQKEWDEKFKLTLRFFFQVKKNKSSYKWVHKRIEEDLLKVTEKREKSSRAGKASAQARERKKSFEDYDLANVQRTFNGRSTDVQRTLKLCSTDVAPYNNNNNNNKTPLTPLEAEGEDFEKKVLEMHVELCEKLPRKSSLSESDRRAIRQGKAHLMALKGLSSDSEVIDRVAEILMYHGACRYSQGLVEGVNNPKFCTLAWMLKPESIDKFYSGDWDSHVVHSEYDAIASKWVAIERKYKT